MGMDRRQNPELAEALMRSIHQPPDGWYAFGHHASPEWDGRRPELEFWGTDDVGDPLWERPKAQVELGDKRLSVTIQQDIEKPAWVEIKRDDMLIVQGWVHPSLPPTPRLETVQASALAWWDEYDREAKAHEVTKAKLDAVREVIDAQGTEGFGDTEAMVAIAKIVLNQEGS